MSDVIRQFSETVSDVRGLFRSCVMARDRGDGWEGWLEFAPAGPDGAQRCSTGIETRQHDRVALERWASGLTHVYAEGALARARVAHPADRPATELLLALQEIVEALDRRIPHVERASESQIAADAKRLRASAIQRMVSLRRQIRNADR